MLLLVLMLNVAPIERQPQFTSVSDAIHYLWDTMTCKTKRRWLNAPAA